MGGNRLVLVPVFENFSFYVPPRLEVDPKIGPPASSSVLGFFAKPPILIFFDDIRLSIDYYPLFFHTKPFPLGNLLQ